jgi:hypothetical protein
MKQHITTKDIGELSAFGREKLRKWCAFSENKHLQVQCINPESAMFLSNNGYLFKGEEREMPFLDFVKALPLLSIGQMIEFLNEKTRENWSIKFHNNLVDLDYPIYKFGPDDYEDSSLCDALWEAVKEVLETNNG